MQKEIEEGNRLIALFMDLRVPLVGQPAFKGQEVGTMYVEPSKIKNWENVELRYRTSWDWLMPVVEKIESTGQGYKFQICRKRVVVIEDWGHQLDVVKVKAQSKIEATWLAVVEFINHHNSQNKSDEH